MSQSKRLAAFRAAASIAPAEDENDPEILPPIDKPGENDSEDNTDEKEPAMADQNDTTAAVDAARNEGHAAGFKAANDRMIAVFASEHYAGRETYAAKLLGKDMKAEGVIDLLADYPKTEAVQQLTPEEKAAAEQAALAAAEKGGRDVMAEQLGTDKNSGIAPDGAGASGVDAKDTPKAKASQILADHRAFTGQKAKTAAAD